MHKCIADNSNCPATDTKVWPCNAGLLTQAAQPHERVSAAGSNGGVRLADVPCRLCWRCRWVLRFDLHRCICCLLRLQGRVWQELSERRTDRCHEVMATMQWDQALGKHWSAGSFECR